MKKHIHIFLLFTLLIIGCGKKPLYQESSITPENELKARDHFTKGMFFEMENKHENALIEFYQALLYDSSSTAIYNRIAENHMALSRYENALRYLQKSIKISPDQPETVRLIADCHYRLKDDEQAIKSLIRTLELDPLDENARSLLLLLYRKNSDYLGLAKQYEQMINIYGEDEEWVRKAATIYLKNGQIDDALALFQTYVKTDSNNAAMWFSIGTTYELKNQNREAIDAYAKAVALSPRVAEAGERIYSLCRSGQNWQKLIEIFEPYINTPHVNLYRLAIVDAYILMEDKNYDKADSLVAPVLEEKNVPWQAYDLKGRIEWGRDNHQIAADYFQKIIDQNGKNRIGWIFKGFVLSDSDSLKAAEAHYRHSLKYLPEDPFLLTFHGVSLQRLDRDEEAVDQFNLALQYDSTYTNAYVSLGISLDRLGREKEAIHILEKALEYEPDHYNAFSTLGMLYDEKKIYDKCDVLYETALKKFPDDPLFLNNYAYSLAERGERLELALEMAKKAIEAEPENGAYQDTIGWIYYMLGQYNPALIHIRKSVELRQDSAVVMEHLGDVYFKLGNFREAQNQWNRALEIDSGNERLKQKIESTHQKI